MDERKKNIIDLDRARDAMREKNERVGRNPKTGEEVPITPRRVLSFRPSHLMKDRVAAGNRRKA